MGSFGIWHLLILLAVVVILFGGGGKLSKIMGDFGKGINAFKSGIKDEETRRREEDEARRRDEDDEARRTIDQVRPAASQTAEGGVRQDDVIRR